MKNYQIYFLVDVDVAELHVLNSHRTETQQTTKKRGEKRLQRCQFVQKTKDRKHVSMQQIQIFNKLLVQWRLCARASSPQNDFTHYHGFAINYQAQKSDAVERTSHLQFALK